MLRKYISEIKLVTTGPISVASLCHFFTRRVLPYLIFDTSDLFNIKSSKTF